MGFDTILLDIDNTIAPYTVHAASERMKDWVCGMRAAGLELFILSNNRGTRPETFAAAYAAAQPQRKHGIYDPSVFLGLSLYPTADMPERSVFIISKTFGRLTVWAKTASL